jgi:DNA-binding NarL/FixJ family response regulator
MAEVCVLLAHDYAVVRSGIRNAMQNLADLEAVAEAGPDGAVPGAAG